MNRVRTRTHPFGDYGGGGDGVPGAGDIEEGGFSYERKRNSNTTEEIRLLKALGVKVK